MVILGIDTSCDDTAIALIELKNGQIKVKSNIISSQIKIHRKYGGVYPTLAKREHEKNLLSVLEKAYPFKKKNNDLEKAKEATLKKILIREPLLFKKITAFFKRHEVPAIDALAVTVGPGLEPALWVGLNCAKALSLLWQKPIIPVNHIEGHLLSNILAFNKVKKFKAKLPAIALIVSGGHSQLIVVKAIGDYKIIGETRDDAAGECFDKTARIIGLHYPGGPAIARAGAEIKEINKSLQIDLPRPMLYSQDYDFSFSGLKTAVLYDYKKRSKTIRNSSPYVQSMAKAIEQAIIDVLVKKSLRAVKDYRFKSLIVAGGVSANEQLRKQLKEKAAWSGINVLFPPKIVSTDNALMIALAGYFRKKEKTNSLEQVTVKAHLRI